MLQKGTFSPAIGYGLAAGVLLGTSGAMYYYGSEGGDSIEFVRVVTTSASYTPGEDDTPLLEAAVYGASLTPDVGPASGVWGYFIIGDPAQDYTTWTTYVPAYYSGESAGADIWTCYPPNLEAGTYGYVAQFTHQSNTVVGDLDGSTNGVTTDQYGILTVQTPSDPSIYVRGEIWPPWAARPDRTVTGSIYIQNESYTTLPGQSFRITTDDGNIMFTFDDSTRRSSIDFTIPSSMSPYSTYYEYFSFDTGSTAPDELNFTLSLLEGGEGSDIKRVLNTGETLVLTSIDPNEKLGPPGVGPNRNVLLGTFNYRVNFENLETALADAQVVIVEDEITYDYEPGSLLFESFGWSNQVFSVDPPSPTFTDSIDISADLRVDVSGGFDEGVSPPKATVTFTTIDKNTESLPAFDGFLPPNDSNGVGEGFITFQILPDVNTPAGTILYNEALITFDTNAPISTSDFPNDGPWFNTIADLPPEEPEAPFPADGSVDVNLAISQLSSANPTGATSFDLYLWPTLDPKPGTPTISGMSQPVLVLTSSLDPNTQYTWQIIAINPWGQTAGPEWTFNTGSTGVEDFMMY